MMKQIVATVTAICFLTGPVYATAYKAQCMAPSGKFKDCKLDVTNDALSVQYERKQNANLNREVSGNSITRISRGEYARRRIGEAVVGTIVFLPLALFAFAKKKRDNFGIEYTNAEGKPDAILVQIKKKYGFALGTSLRNISGKEIEEEEDPKKSKKVEKEVKKEEAVKGS